MDGNAAGAASFSTNPVTFSVIVPLMALDLTVTVLLILPILLVSYLTFNSPDSPGMIGVVGQVGTVQPQDPLHVVI